ncbi:MAG: TonB-dependent receptor [Tannerellaceae bacterium]|jgi:TonB-linked SusC/RagA family outer membrane protein|nr:TonB-dependent receptor [Tannerellaceae bacterium]
MTNISDLFRSSYQFLCDIKCFYVFLGLLILSTAELHAQTIIKGSVVDATTEEPIAGASVILKSTTNGTSTDVNGTFTLQITKDLPVTLSVRLIGYRSQEIDVYDAEEPVIISLSEDLNLLDEVVITGYTSQQRRSVSGSITSLNLSEGIRETAVSGFDQLLQGKIPGVQISSNTGVPGGGTAFRVRGSNSINAGVDPLYIVDGVFISNGNPISTNMGGQIQYNPLSDINPSDIENITVLKDANATAIYGSLGANGVVIITTKRGKQNTKAKISLSLSHGWANAIKKFQSTTGPETAILANEAAYNTAIDRGQDPSTITLPVADPLSMPTYDRNSDLFRTAALSTYEISAQGGNSNSTYYVGLGYTRQESIVKPSDFERYSGRFNYDNNLTSKLKIGTSINLSQVYRNVSSNDNNPKGVINSAIFVRSYLPVYNEDGSYARYGSFDNHLALINHLDNNAVTWRTIGNLFLEYNLLEGLKFRSSWSLDNIDLAENNYEDTFISAGVSTNGAATSYKAKNSVYAAEQLLTYNKIVKEKHALSVLLGNTVNSVQEEYTRASGQGFATNDLKDISVAATKSGSASKSESRLLSFFGKTSYTFNNRYTIDGNLRADASSKFGKNKRWGYFPSIGLTWDASQERFIKNINVFDALKFRGSFGYSGNQNGIGSYAALGLWSAGSNYLEAAGTAPSQLANPDLTWETTRQLDLGFDFAILKNAISFSFDYYNKYTYDLLLNVPVPYRSGFTSFLQNYGAVRNSGVELGIQSANINKKDFKWSTEFNISWNKNKIEKLASDITLGASGRNASILREGYSINSFYLYKQLYVDPETGNAVYEDVNKDGFITSADRQIVGNALPNYTGGLTNEITYKDFSLNLFVYFQQGNKILSMHDFFLVHGGTQNNIGFIPRQLERWQKAGDITDIPRMTTYNGGDPTINGSSANNYGGNVANMSSRYLSDGSFIRLKNLAISYNFPQSVIKPLQLSRLRVTASVTNLFTITKYKGLDPEVNAQSSSQNTYGYDWATVPQPRTVQLTLNATF